MLWFDDNRGRSLALKMEQAKEYYKDKYGKYPDVCYLHPDDLGDADIEALPLKIATAKDILPSHYLLGNQV